MHKFKKGQKVILGRNPDPDDWCEEMEHCVGKQATLIDHGPTYDGKPSWYASINDKRGLNYFQEIVMKLLSCQCNIKDCLTHTKSRMQNS